MIFFKKKNKIIAPTNSSPTYARLNDDIGVVRMKDFIETMETGNYELLKVDRDLPMPSEEVTSRAWLRLRSNYFKAIADPSYDITLNMEAIVLWFRDRIDAIQAYTDALRIGYSESLEKLLRLEGIRSPIDCTNDETYTNSLNAITNEAKRIYIEMRTREAQLAGTKREEQKGNTKEVFEDIILEIGRTGYRYDDENATVLKFCRAFKKLRDHIEFLNKKAERGVSDGR